MINDTNKLHDVSQLFMQTEVIPGLGTLGWTVPTFNQPLADVLKDDADRYAKKQAQGRYINKYHTWPQVRNHIPRQTQ